jgi:hypothetical protein
MLLPSNRLVYTPKSGPLVMDRGPKVLIPLPRISVLTGCHVLARAHLNAGARYIVGRGLGPER